MKENLEEKLIDETVKILTEYEYIDGQQKLYEMADLSRKRTGLKVNIWVDHGANNFRTVGHDTNRLKLGIRGDFEVEISLSHNCKIVAYYPNDLFKDKGSNKTKAINEAIKYIKKNQDLFQKCLDDKDEEYDEDDLKDDLRKRGDYK